MIERKLTKKLLQALQHFRIIMLNGPRQSGKTTLTKHIATQTNMKYITLDDEDRLQFAKNDPKNFIKFYAKAPLIIDEIQFAPELIPVIKESVDEKNQKGMFLLTGSADFMKMQKVTESLAGRMVRYNLYPFSNAEINQKNLNMVDVLFDERFLEIQTFVSLEKVLEVIVQGGYPEIIAFDEEFRRDWFRSYIESRIQKDIRSLKEIHLSKLHIIKTLLKLLATYTSSLLNYSNIAKKLQIDNKTVTSYIELLEAMYIIKTIPSYFVNHSLRVIKSPKIHFIDTGLASSLLNVNVINLFENKDGIYGNLIENFVYSELLKESTYTKNSVEIYHFRDLRKQEVDFVIERNDAKIIAIEVKAKASIKKNDLKAMIELANNSQERFIRGIVFYGGDEIMPFFVDGIEVYLVPLGSLA